MYGHSAEQILCQVRILLALRDVTSREHWDQWASACATFLCFVRVCFRYELTVKAARSGSQWSKTKGDEGDAEYSERALCWW